MNTLQAQALQNVMVLIHGQEHFGNLLTTVAWIAGCSILPLLALGAVFGEVSAVLRNLIIVCVVVGLFGLILGQLVQASADKAKVEAPGRIAIACEIATQPFKVEYDERTATTHLTIFNKDKASEAHVFLDGNETKAVESALAGSSDPAIRRIAAELP